MFKRIAAASLSGLVVVVRSFLRDCAGLAGVGLIAYGAWLLHPAAGFITGGILLVAGVYLLSAQAQRAGD